LKSIHNINMGINIKYLGHSSFLIKIDKKKILTDPYFSDKSLGKLKRLINCSENYLKIPKIDSILISHEHMDACEIDSINELAKKHSPKIISHCSVLNKLNIPRLNKVPIDEYEIKTIKDVMYKAYPAHHPSSFYPLSYLITSKDNLSVYFAGDTFMTKDHEKIKPTVAILPIGGKRTMDIGTAIRVSKKMKPKFLIPMHFNTFEDIKRNPMELLHRLDKTSYKIKTIVLEPGKSFTLK